MNERISEKIKEIEEYLQNLFEISPDSLEEYKNNWKTRAICERLCEKIAEACVDLAFLIFKKELDKDKNIRVAKDDSEVFEIIRDKNIISPELCKKLIHLKGMRNIIAHEYGKVDDEIVFEIISNELERDASKFIRCIEEKIK